jgi:hypothetical protein
MAVLRRELDMLVSVREASLAAAFIDVLKGGRRKPQADPTTTEENTGRGAS